MALPPRAEERPATRPALARVAAGRHSPDARVLGPLLHERSAAADRPPPQSHRPASFSSGLPQQPPQFPRRRPQRARSGAPCSLPRRRPSRAGTTGTVASRGGARPLTCLERRLPACPVLARGLARGGGSSGAARARVKTGPLVGFGHDGWGKRGAAAGSRRRAFSDHGGGRTRSSRARVGTGAAPRAGAGHAALGVHGGARRGGGACGEAPNGGGLPLPRSIGASAGRAARRGIFSLIKHICINT